MLNNIPSVMWLNQDRVFYVGLLGQTTLRVFGAYIVYVAVDQRFEFRVAGQTWQECGAAIVPPETPHWVRTRGRRIATLLLEPEYLDLSKLNAALGCRAGPIVGDGLPQRVVRLQQRLCEQGDGSRSLSAAELDQALFASIIGGRSCEPRIELAVNALRSRPFDVYLANDGVTAAGLSYSRFLHLFKAEVGVSFRAFRSWKRARMLLQQVNRGPVNFTQLALDSGYPDATHFSHSIRRIYGLNPRDIFQGSRRLAVHVAEGV